MVESRLELDDYTTRVLDVVKGKYGLKNRSDALNKFAKKYGVDLVENEFDGEYLREIDLRLEKHVKRHGIKGNSISVDELDELLGIGEK